MDQKYRSPKRDFGVHHNGAFNRASLAGFNETAMEVFDARPLITVCAVFGAGLALGVGLVAAYSQACPQQTTAQSLARRISDAVLNSLPEQLRTSLSHT
jgi:hypothetical protein